MKELGLIINKFAELVRETRFEAEDLADKVRRAIIGKEKASIEDKEAIDRFRDAFRRMSLENQHDYLKQLDERIKTDIDL